jgi:hypothetical protein
MEYIILMNPKTKLKKKIVWHNQQNEKEMAFLSNSAMSTFRSQVSSMQLQHKVKNRVPKSDRETLLGTISISNDCGIYTRVVQE